MRLNQLRILCYFLIFLPGVVMAAMDSIKIAKQNESYLFSIRNQLHQYPEICWEEEKSLSFVKSELEKIKPIKGRALKIYDHHEGGLVADLTIDNPRQFLLFRADIDALPVEEDPSHEVVSKIKGMMHACGHDVHSAMLLTAAKVLLTDASVNPTSNIRFIWQRAEENPGANPEKHSGGYTLVKEKVLDNIDEVYGIHIWSKLPSGQLYSANKAIMGTADRLKFDIYASGGHSSSPHQGVNALRVAHALMEALREVHVRILGPTEAVSLEPTILHAGTVSNIMPAHAELWYTLRTLMPPEPLEAFQAEIKKVVQNIAQQFEVKIDANFKGGYPATINNTEIFQSQKAYLNSKGLTVKDATPILAAEDFSYYLQQRPGVFWLLGANQPTTGAHHSPTFNPDTKAFHQGVALWLLLATKPA